MEPFGAGVLKECGLLSAERAGVGGGDLAYGPPKLPDGVGRALETYLDYLVRGARPEVDGHCVARISAGGHPHRRGALVIQTGYIEPAIGGAGGQCGAGGAVRGVDGRYVLPVGDSIQREELGPMPPDVLVIVVGHLDLVKGEIALVVEIPIPHLVNGHLRGVRHRQQGGLLAGEGARVAALEGKALDALAAGLLLDLEPVYPYPATLVRAVSEVHEHELGMSRVVVARPMR